MLFDFQTMDNIDISLLSDDQHNLGLLDIYAKHIYNQIETISMILNSRINLSGNQVYDAAANSTDIAVNSTDTEHDVSNSSIKYSYNGVEDDADGGIINVAAYETYGDTSITEEQVVLSDMLSNITEESECDLSQLSTDTEYLSVEHVHNTTAEKNLHPTQDFPSSPDYEQISTVSESASATHLNNTFTCDSLQGVTVPYKIACDSPFRLFDTAKLDASTNFTHGFNNRSAVYYGTHPYSYSDTATSPRLLRKTHTFFTSSVILGLFYRVLYLIVR